MERESDSSPDIFVPLDINLVKHGPLLTAGDIGLHFDGDVTRQHRQQESFLEKEQKEKR